MVPLIRLPGFNGKIQRLFFVHAILYLFHKITKWAFYTFVYFVVPRPVMWMQQVQKMLILCGKMYTIHNN
jgi:hypothetical protein